MKQLLLILSTGLLFACGDNALEDLSTQSQLQNKENKAREYIKQSYGEDSTLRSEVYYENGDLVDVDYYANGSIGEKTVYSNFRDGGRDYYTAFERRVWFENGQIKYEELRSLENTKPLYKEAKWYENGQKRYVRQYRFPDIDYTKFKNLAEGFGDFYDDDDFLILECWDKEGNYKDCR